MTTTHGACAIVPANTTTPSAAARTGVLGRAAMLMPRCPGPYAVAGASNGRTTRPVTGHTHASADAWAGVAIERDDEEHKNEPAHGCLPRREESNAGKAGGSDVEASAGPIAMRATSYWPMRPSIRSRRRSA